VDYDAVDKEVKMEERMVYDRYYKGHLSEAQLRKAWGKTYKGFDDADWEKVKNWLAAQDLDASDADFLFHMLNHHRAIYRRDLGWKFEG